jgi:DNA (cytosine-5)-methyltransferase 1
MGYAQAGFDVTGVDIDPQPNYPFPFVQADALALDMTFLRSFDAIHASPMCQAHSPLNAYNKKVYPDQIDATRAMLLSAGRPYVIENVVQAPLLVPVILCGSMFGLRVYRHRGFEASFPITILPHPPHLQRCVRNGYLPNDRQFMTVSGGKHSESWRVMAATVMGVPWTRTIREVCESIPPAYTRHIGEQLLKYLTEMEEAAVRQSW